MVGGTQLVSDKREVNLKSVILHLIQKLDKDQFIRFVNMGRTLSIDEKSLTNEELKSVTAFVRLMRKGV